MKNITRTIALVKQVLNLLAGANVTAPVTCLADRYPYISL